MERDPHWLSTDDAGRKLGMSSEWVRRQILAGRLEAVAYRVGPRSIYRIRTDWLRRFQVNYSRKPGEDE
jgi:hypothetical protein